MAKVVGTKSGNGGRMSLSQKVRWTHRWLRPIKGLRQTVGEIQVWRRTPDKTCDGSVGVGQQAEACEVVGRRRQRES